MNSIYLYEVLFVHIQMSILMNVDEAYFIYLKEKTESTAGKYTATERQVIQTFLQLVG